jgi:hypothetical protein
MTHDANGAAGHRISREPIRSDRVRRIDGGSFAFVPHRFLRSGFYASLTPDEAALYLLLVIVGDRNGVSYYSYDSLSSLLQVDPDRYVDARDGLIDRDLVAFDGTRFQVLSLPEHPVRARARGEAAEHSGSERSAIRRSIREALLRDP